MSGGAFDYYQYRIDDIINRIEEEIECATKPRPATQTVKYVSVWRMYNEHSSYGVNEHEFRKCKDLNEVRKIFEKRKKTYKVVEDKGNRIIFEEDGNRYYVYAGQYEEYPPEIDEYGYTIYPYYPDYTEETIAEFRKGVEILKKAEIYTQRIDWLISGDDSEESFHKRLREELDKLNNYDIQR